MGNNSSESRQFSAFRPVPRTGVIYVMTEAARLGYRPESADWCNLGQGHPETGSLPGAPPRIESIHNSPEDSAYAPVAGIWELREAVASFYNQLFRRGMRSQYSAENVAICGGGRVSLIRACATIGSVHLGHFLPDYTAYEELLDVFRRFLPTPILLDPQRAYAFGAADLEREIVGRGLGALLMSNPCNPTGKNVAGDELQAWVRTASKLDCAMLFDEFYSHYIWNDKPTIQSAAAYVEDVDRDPILVFDGLTKNWRYPGWRVTWALGPRTVIDGISSAGSFLDGGGSRPMQQAAVPLLDVEMARQETSAIHSVFLKKRDKLLSGLKRLGVRVEREPQGTFYVWGDLSDLPPSIREADAFFREALKQKVVVVPGTFFDVDPGKRRDQRPSRFRHHVRFSFGPPEGVIDLALSRIENVIRAAR